MTGRMAGKVKNNLLKRILHCIWNYLSRLFTVPLSSDPIYFGRPESDFSQNIPETTEGNSYEEITAKIIQKAFEGRKEKMKGRDTYDIAFNIEVKYFPGWDDKTVDQLRNQFKAYDRKGEGTIDFESLNTALTKFGNKSIRDERKIHFDFINQDRGGVVDFEEFCMMAYNLRKGKNVNVLPETLSELYKNLDRDISSIRTLTVVEQIQSGLF